MGAGIREQYSDYPENNLFGVITGSVLGAQFPNEPFLLARIRANSANIGSFFLGNSSTNCEFELDAGDDTGWFGGQNLNELYSRNPSGTSDYLQWWLQR